VSGREPRAPNGLEMSRPAGSRILLDEPRPPLAGSGSIELLGGLAILNASMATEAVLHWAGRLISAVIPVDINGSVNPGQG